MRTSLCGPSFVYVVIMFMKSYSVCAIDFLPELSGFHNNITFVIRRAHLQKYREITIRRAHLCQSIGMKCMWYLIFSLNTEKLKTNFSSSSQTHLVIRRTRAPGGTPYRDTKTYRKGYVSFERQIIEGSKVRLD